MDQIETAGLSAETAKAAASSIRPDSGLSPEQHGSLQILGYLFIRMGQYQKAEQLFNALAVLCPDDKWTQKSLAAIAMAQNNGQKALDHLRMALADGPASAADSALYLLRARALWSMGRKDEARNAVDDYLMHSPRSAGGK